MPIPFWDIDEYENYIVVNSPIYNSKYSIISYYKNRNRAIILLTIIDKLIRTYASIIKKNFDDIPNNLKDGFKVFLYIHPNKHRLFELPINSDFIGLNKPKDIKINNKLPSVGEDGNLKPNKRYIFIKLRNKNGSFINIIDIFETVVHEIAHTAANHVKWRNDDHKQDFKLYYNYLKGIKLYN